MGFRFCRTVPSGCRLKEDGGSGQARLVFVCEFHGQRPPAAASGKNMIVIAWVGHAMRRAVPSAITKDGLTLRIVIPQVEGLYEELASDDMVYFVSGRE